ncbi:unnamed protein product [Prorocentrum cordatum]|uniref:Beta-galactosidase n=1 Tax=Prorocentrum cordatum TaxID=2364126 RepID=A0ABN9VVA4_9DINO|nr:unnamed protein product [Polarella glacialis]
MYSSISGQAHCFLLLLELTGGAAESLRADSPQSHVPRVRGDAAWLPVWEKDGEHFGYSPCGGTCPTSEQSGGARCSGRRRTARSAELSAPAALYRVRWHPLEEEARFV